MPFAGPMGGGGAVRNNLAFPGDETGVPRRPLPAGAQGTPTPTSAAPTQAYPLPAGAQGNLTPPPAGPTSNGPLIGVPGSPGHSFHLPTGLLTPNQVPAQTVQQLPQGTATQPGNVAATAPLPYQTFGGIAQVSPSFANPGDQQAYLQQYEQMLQQSMNPYFQQQQQQLNSDLRARGIQDSGAAGYLEGNLLGQQGATIAGQEAPFVSQAFGYANQDVMANQNAANEAALYNANAYQNGVNQNYDAYNNYLQQLLGLGGSDYGALQAAYLNSFGPSTGVQSGYNSALAGTQNVFGNVYGNAMNNQQQQMNQLGQYLAMSGGG